MFEREGDVVRESLVRRIRELLAEEPGRSARELAAAIDAAGVTKTDVNSVLHAQHGMFEKTDDTPPRWSLRSAPAGSGAVPASRPAAVPPTSSPTVRPSGRSAAPSPARFGSGSAPQSASPREALGAWQRQALSAWQEHHHRGVVEAVDGSGKTALGVAAAAEALEAGHPVLVVVPDADGRRRWTDALHAALPARRIVASGAGTPSHGDVTVVTPDAAIQDRLFDKHSGGQPTALIVDDVHTYSAGAYAKALLPRFDWRLGLTSGLARPDDLVDTVVLPYFEQTVPGCDYLHAVQTGLLPRIHLAQVPLQLGERERSALNSVEDRAEQALDTLVGTYGAPDTPAEAAEFARAALRAKGRAAVFAKRYLDALTKRAEILGECRAKITLLQALPAATLKRTRAIFFTDQALAANRAVQLLGHDGYRITRVGESLGAADRGDIARRLREDALHAIVERRVLDPALAFPFAGLGMFLSPDLTAPELAQRLGRIIRHGGAHTPIVVLAYAEGTVEDPRRVGPHLRRLAQIAEGVVVTDARGLPGLLDQWIPAAAAEPGTTSAPERPAPPEPTAAPAPAESGTAGTEVATEPDRFARPERAVEPERFITPRRPIAPVVAAVPERSTEPEEQEADTVTAELTAALRAEGGVATADELGDLIGLTDPREMFAAVSAAADAGRLEFQQIEPGSEELILLSAESGGTAAQRRAAVVTIADWAAHSDDPIDEFPRVLSDLAPIRVPGHRLVGIAAFLRGTTPAGLL
ncbi:DEAD/DEAH box helicase family protein [Nocardia higoensis]|uniref:DEAD/DEAH box helicase family protein n=1 Tax=Nocardia higoensis TaxID=228599 RepID=UPI0012F63014|nr:DEAD/DEAH box helicase family protein [Nocardia higoensis]